MTSDDFEASHNSVTSEMHDIVHSLKSVQGYMLLGFNHATATILWNRYTSVDDPECPYEFIDVAKFYIQSPSIKDAETPLENWSVCLNALGVSQQLHDAILLPEFEDLRYTASCKFWVCRAIEINYNTYIDLEKTIQASPTIRKLNQDDESVLSNYPKSSNSKVNETPGKVSLKEPLNNNSGKGKEKELVVVATKAEAPALRPFHTMLWRCEERSKAYQFYNQETGEIQLDAIAISPGDFNGKVPVTYFTPQKQIADRMSCWTKRKCEAANIVVIQVAVPEALTNSLRKSVLYIAPNQLIDEWKMMVFWGRRGKRLPRGLKSLEKLKKNTDLFIGPVARSTNNFWELSDWTQINNSHIYKIDVNGEQRLGLQWVFESEKAQMEFEHQCVGKIYFHDVGVLKTSP